MNDNNKINDDACNSGGERCLQKGEQGRQGDVLLVPIGNVTGAVKPDTAPEKHVTAYGEVTGHKHQFEVDKVGQRYQIETKAGNAVVIELHEGAVMRHEEHGAIAAPPDRFIVDRQQEYDYSREMFRQVAD